MMMQGTRLLHSNYPHLQSPFAETLFRAIGFPANPILVLELLQRPNAASELARPFDLLYCCNQCNYYMKFDRGVAQETVGAAAANLIEDWEYNCSDRPYLLKVMAGLLKNGVRLEGLYTFQSQPLSEKVNEWVQGQRFCGGAKDETPPVFDAETEATFARAGYQFETPQWRIDRRNDPNRASRLAPEVNKFGIYKFERWDC